MAYPLFSDVPTTGLPADVDRYNKVPEVTASFWAIKVMATTVGETGADYLIFKMGLGLPMTSILMTVVLAVILFWQMRSDRYTPWIYWLAVTMISIVGTLITDSLTDTYGVPLQLSSIVFILALIATFAIWYSREHTLSIHSIDTLPREGFYWLAVLITFALGTATGDLLAEQLGLGYFASALLFGAAILVVVGLWRARFIGPVTAFWLAYILTRPLGASLGDLLSQPVANGGLGLGTTNTSLVFLAVILVLVVYLTLAATGKSKRAES